MVPHKYDKNQLDLLKEFSDTEELSSPPVAPKESAADKALREINEKLKVAEQNKKRKEEGKWVDTSLKKIRKQIEDEQEDFKPADEYHGRFNRYRKSK